MTTSGTIMEFTVYKITNKFNGKFYIGITGKGALNRWKRHVYSAKSKCKHGRLPAAILKYGKDGFMVETLEVYATADEAKEAEIRLIKALSPEYNCTLGGDGTSGHVLSMEQREKARQRMLGSKLNLGRRWSEAQKFQMSLKLQGRKAPNPTELMQKNRAEICRKRALATRKKVICLTTGVHYDSIAEAASAHGLCKTTVSAICRNKRKAAYGIKFQFAVAA